MSEKRYKVRQSNSHPRAPDPQYGIYNCTVLFKLFKQSSRRDAQFLRGARKAARRDHAGLGCRRVLVARDRGVSNTLLGDQRVRGRRDRIGLDSAVVAATLSREVGSPTGEPRTGALGAPPLVCGSGGGRAEVWDSACYLALGAAQGDAHTFWCNTCWRPIARPGLSPPCPA